MRGNILGVQSTLFMGTDRLERSVTDRIREAGISRISISTRLPISRHFPKLRSNEGQGIDCPKDYMPSPLWDSGVFFLRGRKSTYLASVGKGCGEL